MPRKNQIFDRTAVMEMMKDFHKTPDLWTKSDVEHALKYIDSLKAQLHSAVNRDEVEHAHSLRTRKNVEQTKINFFFTLQLAGSILEGLDNAEKFWKMTNHKALKGGY
ncbi:hypothetical protein IOU64_004436 [Salmonella enterica]|nr:hypothetical protein [Salmonella enterica]